MIDGDELFICEINPRLLSLLKSRLEKMPSYQKRRANIRFFCGPAQELPEDKKFDVIVCALPFLNFDLKTVKSIFSKILAVSNKGAVMTYYEYIGLRPLNFAFAPAKRKQRMKDVHHFFKEFSKEHEIKRGEVWLNVLPIHVYNVDLVA